MALIARNRRPRIAVGSKAPLSRALEPAPKRRTAADRHLLHNDDLLLVDRFGRNDAWWQHVLRVELDQDGSRARLMSPAMTRMRRRSPIVAAGAGTMKRAPQAPSVNKPYSTSPRRASSPKAATDRVAGPAVSAGLCSLPIKFRPLSLLVQRRQHLVKSRRRHPEDSGKGVAQLEDQEQCAADRESAKGEGGERGGVDPRE
jgi:hypothetical protein